MTKRLDDGPLVEPARCPWARSALSRQYHDEEWGVPVHDDRTLFEFLVLEGAQAGLNWEMILRKRENYRRAFRNFNPEAVARFDHRAVERLMRDAGIIRNRLKIESAIGNAKSLLTVREEFGSFDAYIWRFVGGAPSRNGWKSAKQVPARTAESDAMSRDLRARGFNFAGPTVCCAFRQAAGMVNDHPLDCFRWLEIDERPSVQALRRPCRGAAG